MLLCDVRAVVESGRCPTGEVGKSAALEEPVLASASAAPVRRVRISGALEAAAWLCLEVWPIIPSLEATVAKSSCVGEAARFSSWGSVLLDCQWFLTVAETIRKCTCENLPAVKMKFKKTATAPWK